MHGRGEVRIGTNGFAKRKLERRAREKKARGRGREEKAPSDPPPKGFSFLALGEGEEMAPGKAQFGSAVVYFRCKAPPYIYLGGSKGVSWNQAPAHCRFRKGNQKEESRAGPNNSPGMWGKVPGDLIWCVVEQARRRQSKNGEEGIENNQFQSEKGKKCGE